MGDLCRCVAKTTLPSEPPGKSKKKHYNTVKQLSSNLNKVIFLKTWNRCNCDKFNKDLKIKQNSIKSTVEGEAVHLLTKYPQRQEEGF